MEMESIVERAVSHSREYGKFIVIYQQNVKFFDSLVTAFVFYFHLEHEATLWDITKEAELLEKKCLKHP